MDRQLLRAMRERAGLTQDELAVRAGVSVAQISRFETGMREPKMDHVVKIAAALGCRLEDLGVRADLAAVVPLPPQVAVNQQADLSRLRKSDTTNIPNANLFSIASRDIPLLSATLGGADDSIVEGSSMDGLSVPGRLADAEGAFAVMVVGETMEPVYSAGDVVCCLPGTAVRRGDKVVVRVIDGDGRRAVFIKRFVESKGDTIVVEQHNPAKTLEFSRDSTEVFKVVLAISAGYTI